MVVLERVIYIFTPYTLRGRKNGMAFRYEVPELYLLLVKEVSMSYIQPRHLHFAVFFGAKLSCVLPSVIRSGTEMLHNCTCCCLQVCCSQHASVTQRLLHDSCDSPRAACPVWLRKLRVFLPEHTEQTQDDTRLQERSSVHGQGLREERRQSLVPSRQRERPSWVYARQVGCTTGTPWAGNGTVARYLRTQNSVTQQ
jgi:hypothetical protein